MAFIDETGRYVGPSPSTPEAERMALRKFRETKRGTRVEYGENRHHTLFTRICTDQNLYRSGLLPADQCHPDSDLSTLPSQLAMARDFLSLAGSSIPDSMPSLQVISRALRKTDFPELLADTANRAATLGFDSAPEVWPLITRITHNRNFKPFTRITAPELPAPSLVPEVGEVTFAPLGAESAETGQILSYAEIVSTTRELLIDDDLTAITVTPHAAGRAVSRLLGNKVFEILITNGVMADGTVLFHSDHNNVGTGAVPSATTLDEIFSLMASQTGASGETLNIRPRFILAAPGKESSLATLRTSMNDPDPNDPSTGKISTLTDGRLTGDTWYALADPDITDCIQIVLLEGDATPLRVERRKANSDGAEFLVGADCEVLAVDYRTAAKNAGA